MKVNVDVSIKNGDRFGGLNVGDVFEYDNAVYLKVFGDMAVEIYNLLRQDTEYDTVDFNECDLVRPLQAELKIWE